MAWVMAWGHGVGGVGRGVGHGVGGVGHGVCHGVGHGMGGVMCHHIGDMLLPGQVVMGSLLVHGSILQHGRALHMSQHGCLCKPLLLGNLLRIEAVGAHDLAADAVLDAARRFLVRAALLSEGN